MLICEVFFPSFQALKFSALTFRSFPKKACKRYTFIFLTKKDRYFLPGCCWNMILRFHNSSSPFFLRFHYYCFRNSPTEMFLPSFFCRWFYELSSLNVFITCSLSWIILKFLKFFENSPRSLTIDKNFFKT